MNRRSKPLDIIDNIGNGKKEMSFEYFGKSPLEIIPFFGVVEDNNDPLRLGRARVRIFGFHPESRTAVSTLDLPWATVMTPTTSAAVSGIGETPQLLPGCWVFGFLLDGEHAQHPMVIGTINAQHRSNPNGIGGAPNDARSGYHSSQVHGQSSRGAITNQTNGITGRFQTGNQTIADNGQEIKTEEEVRRHLKIYTIGDLTRGGSANAQFNRETFRFHLATALALEALTVTTGGRKFQINSAYRDPRYNRIVGGASRSLHMVGRALDISRSSIPNVENFLREAVKVGFVGFGFYNTFIHIDTGSGRTWGPITGPQYQALVGAGWRPGVRGFTIGRPNNITEVNQQAQVPTPQGQIITPGNTRPAGPI